MVLPYTQMKVDPKDILDLRKRLEKFERVQSRKIIRKATRRTVKVHLQNQMKLATPIGETGKLRASVRVRAIKRSRKGLGHQAISKDVKRKGVSSIGRKYYGSFVQFGRTFNMFLGKRAWANVPDSWKGKGNRLWRKGSQSWKRTADRREPIAIRSCIRLMNRLIDIEIKKKTP